MSERRSACGHEEGFANKKVPAANKKSPAVKGRGFISERTKSACGHAEDYSWRLGFFGRGGGTEANFFFLF